MQKNNVPIFWPANEEGEKHVISPVDLVGGVGSLQTTNKAISKALALLASQGIFASNGQANDSAD